MYGNAMHCTAQCAIWVDWIYWPADMFCNVLWGIHECWEIAPLLSCCTSMVAEGEQERQAMAMLDTEQKCFNIATLVDEVYQS